MRRERTKLREIANVTSQLAELQRMDVPRLRERYEELYGIPSRQTSPAYLRKKLAWRIQELAEGGLSDRAKARIEELAEQCPVRFRASKTQKTAPSPEPEKPDRDPRLPPPGTEIVRTFRDRDHRVTVLRDGFEYEGQRYPTLSKIARVISGTNWNGFLFFHLTQRTRKAAR